jgi:hypothetical protein
MSMHTLRWRYGWRITRARNTCLKPWHALLGCRICHGTGVIMSPGCDCGAGPYSPCEAHCSTVLCPHGCTIAESRDAASSVWEQHWPGREQPGYLLSIRDGKAGEWPDGTPVTEADLAAIQKRFPSGNRRRTVRS